MSDDSEADAMQTPDSEAPVERETRLADYNARLACFKKHAASAQLINRTAMFDALAAAQIVSVIIAFDGCGDSGQIETVEAIGPECLAVPLPQDAFALQSARFSDPVATTTTAVSVRDAIVEIAFDLLTDTYGNSWADNDGAYGQFAFDVAARSIKLRFNERYLDSRLFEHEL